LASPGNWDRRIDKTGASIKTIEEEKGRPTMRSILYLIAVVAVVSGAVACGKEATTNANSAPPSNAPAAAAVAENVKPEPAADVKEAAEIKAPATADKPKPAPRTTIPAGTRLSVALLDAVSSDGSEAGDSFMASLTQPVVVNGKTVLAKGTKVRGRVVDAKGSGRVKGLASLELRLTEVIRNGKPIEISTKTYTAVAEKSTKRDATIVGGAAGIGAAIGAIAGGGKGAAIGAAAGGAGGTGTVLATKGKEVRYGAEDLLSFTLSAPVQI
jgi:hypothetical protein